MSKLDPAFDDLTHIDGLTVNNIGEISFPEFIRILSPLVLAQVPESYATDEDKRRLDYLLARLANLHTYLVALWCQASYLRAKMKKLDDAKAEEIQKKKESLYELAASVKLKYEAVSRKVTVLLENENSKPDHANYTARETRRDERSSQPESAPKATASPYDAGARRANGRTGWGNLKP